ncbi:MAG: hypothetical protein TECD_01208 [Hyphomicrobiaceae bacterium hypho_1]
MLSLKVEEFVKYKDRDSYLIGSRLDINEECVTTNDIVEIALLAFNKTQNEKIPVVSNHENKIVRGLVNKIDTIKAFNGALI